MVGSDTNRYRINKTQNPTSNTSKRSDRGDESVDTVRLSSDREKRPPAPALRKRSEISHESQIHLVKKHARMFERIIWLAAQYLPEGTPSKTKFLKYTYDDSTAVDILDLLYNEAAQGIRAKITDATKDALAPIFKQAATVARRKQRERQRGRVIARANRLLAKEAAAILSMPTEVAISDTEHEFGPPTWEQHIYGHKPVEHLQIPSLIVHTDRQLRSGRIWKTEDLDSA